MGAIALVELDRLDEGNARRREIAARYRDALNGVGGLRYIGHANEGESSRHLAQFECPERDKLNLYLDSVNIGTGVHYRSNSRYPMYADQKTPKADYYDQRILSLPLHLRLSNDDVEHVIASIRDCVAPANGRRVEAAATV
jgi:dTDP-4-amino-4,6-dideoxygalactose transaminase